MYSQYAFSRKVLIFILIALILLVGKVTVPDPVKAATPSDGRINLIPWVNSWGAVAVYCIDKNGATTSFTGGGIKVLSGSGQQLLFASEKLIKLAQTLADKTGHRVLILKQGVYSLYALPNGFFELDSAPDAEGKLFIGKWQGCTPVGPGPETGPSAPACVPFPVPACGDERAVGQCQQQDNPDCDGNPDNNEKYCFQNQDCPS